MVESQNLNIVLLELSPPLIRFEDFLALQNGKNSQKSFADKMRDCGQTSQKIEVWEICDNRKALDNPNIKYKELNSAHLDERQVPMHCGLPTCPKCNKQEFTRHKILLYTQFYPIIQYGGTIYYDTTGKKSEIEAIAKNTKQKLANYTYNAYIIYDPCGCHCPDCLPETFKKPRHKPWVFIVGSLAINKNTDQIEDISLTLQTIKSLKPMKQFPPIMDLFPPDSCHCHESDQQLALILHILLEPPPPYSKELADTLINPAIYGYYYPKKDSNILRRHRRIRQKGPLANDPNHIKLNLFLNHFGKADCSKVSDLPPTSWYRINKCDHARHELTQQVYANYTNKENEKFIPIRNLEILLDLQYIGKNKFCGEEMHLQNKETGELLPPTLCSCVLRYEKRKPLEQESVIESEGNEKPPPDPPPLQICLN